MARLTVQFPSKTDAILSELAEKEEITKTEVIRRALSLYKFLDREAKQKGLKIAIADQDDNIIKEILYTD